MNGDETYCRFHQGCLHGFSKTFDRDHRLINVCLYTNGTPSGYVWQCCTGGGYLVGQLNKAGQLTGRDISFIYPDLDTGITGRDTVLGDYINRMKTTF
ncbi:histone-lysine N-methyltransferase SETD7 [Eurytemora carolleeae]|uniref:histone-lysine N-methyltransferase SETD7 n=1 Tax=Eurytemora carolleeae TaxID=1294199 RepID=UPI000C76FE21|nr:histone-lysine N-methyltransferase SETD7 [Eurytemora carolleeae]|eukprot:XP_023346047.1 histone-lysine N-methyltransferase SETD7-like [Eurytemora affinis]